MEERKLKTPGQFLLRKESEIAAQRDLARGIHLARAQSKRLIALLRIFRGHIDKAEFHARKRRIKAAADLLAADRDRHIVRNCILELANDLKKKASGKITDWVERKLREPNEAQLTKRFESAEKKLSKELRDLSFIEKAEDFSETFETGIDDLCGEARKAFFKAEKKCTVKTLHAFRRAVKTLVLDFECAEASKIDIDRKLQKRLDRLQKLLGKINDRAVARNFLKRARGLDEKVLANLAGRLKGKRCSLQKKAFECGRKIFAEK